jgi:hypothetical protein
MSFVARDATLFEQHIRLTMAQAPCALQHAPSLHDALATLLSGNRADSSTSGSMQN